MRMLMVNHKMGRRHKEDWREPLEPDTGRLLTLLSLAIAVAALDILF